jgi:hypothetical protein
MCSLWETIMHASCMVVVLYHIISKVNVTILLFKCENIDTIRVIHVDSRTRSGCGALQCTHIFY